jgi:3-oxoacyl-[acyl-carrier protein] reductase
MRAAGFGSIVVIGSTVTSSLPPNTAPYAAGKMAGQALVRVLALEERAHGVRVNAVAPGLVDTEMGSRLVEANSRRSIADLASTYPFRRVCRPEDVADAVAFLSRRDSYITGHVLVVDGGGPPTTIY